MVFGFLAADTLDAQSYQGNLKGLIFLGIFLILAIAAFIWWLRR
jgi:hypothetical protein